jgi:hypothetical protein
MWESDNGIAPALHESMCRRVQCEICQKPTFSGCGRHVEQVLGKVPEADRCHCQSAANNVHHGRPSALGIVAPMLQTSAA